jgi:hypothetical protein
MALIHSQKIAEYIALEVPDLSGEVWKERSREASTYPGSNLHKLTEDKSPLL